MKLTVYQSEVTKKKKKTQNQWDTYIGKEIYYICNWLTIMEQVPRFVICRQAEDPRKPMFQFESKGLSQFRHC